jgi:hypothetical protein
MAYVPTKPNATPCAADAASRFSTATGQAVIAVDTLVALEDNILCSTGFQAQPTSGALGTQTTATTSFADLTGASCTFTAPIAKTYEVQVQVSPFMTVAQDGLFFRLLNNGSTVADNTTNASMHVFIVSGALLAYQLMTFIVPVPCVVGANLIKLQWRLEFGNPGSIGKVDSGSHFVVTVRG